MAEKKSVYLQDRDLKRLGVITDLLRARYPAHRVTASWVFRYALYRLAVRLGSEVEGRDVPVEGKE